MGFFFFFFPLVVREGGGGNAHLYLNRDLFFSLRFFFFFYCFNPVLLTCLANTAMSSLKDSEEQTSPPATPGSLGVHVANSHFSKISAKRGNRGCLKENTIVTHTEGKREGKKDHNETKKHPNTTIVSPAAACAGRGAPTEGDAGTSRRLPQRPGPFPQPAGRQPGFSPALRRYLPADTAHTTLGQAKNKTQAGSSSHFELTFLVFRKKKNKKKLKSLDVHFCLSCF